MSLIGNLSHVGRVGTLRPVGNRPPQFAFSAASLFSIGSIVNSQGGDAIYRRHTGALASLLYTTEYLTKQ